MEPSAAEGEEVSMLEKMNRLIRYAPTKIAEARHAVRQGTRFAFQKDQEELRATVHKYNRPAPAYQETEIPQPTPDMPRGERRELVRWQRAQQRDRARNDRRTAHEKRRAELNHAKDDPPETST